MEVNENQATSEGASEVVIEVMADWQEEAGALEATVAGNCCNNTNGAAVDL